MVLLKLLILFFSINHSFAKSQPLCSIYLNDLALNQRLIKSNFNTFRDVAAYEHHLYGLIKLLNRLDSVEGSEWIDLGSGKNLAIASYFSIYKSEERSKLHATGITYRIPIDRGFNHILPDEGNFKSIVGRFFEDIPISELPKADIITDVFGPLSYSTHRFREALILAITILKDQGVLYINNGALDLDALTWFFYNGEKLNLFEFLSTIEGLNIAESAVGVGIKITKTSKFDINSIPNFELLESNDGSPPFRIYKVNK